MNVKHSYFLLVEKNMVDSEADHYTILLLRNNNTARIKKIARSAIDFWPDWRILSICGKTRCAFPPQNSRLHALIENGKETFTWIDDTKGIIIFETKEEREAFISCIT